MFEEIFESDPPRYYLPSELSGIPSGVGLSSLYNAYLVTAPRIYAEALYTGGFLLAAFVQKERTPYSDFTLHLMSQVDSIYWPGFRERHWWFDGMTGAYLGTDNYVASALFSDQIWQARDGGLWVFTGAGAYEIYEVEQQTYTEISGTRLEPSDFGATTIATGMVDRAENVIVLNSNLESSNQVGVYNLTTGALVRRFYVSGAARQILPEDNKRCYVINTNGILNLVDYTTGDVLSALRAPGIESGAVDYLYTWDRFLRRLLVFVQRADDTNGACLSTFSGYYPVPVGVGLTQPIPLKAPRANRTVPMLVRVYGDAGEAVPGVKIEPAVSGDTEITRSPPFTDRDGDAVVSLLQDASGSETLTVTADV